MRADGADELKIGSDGEASVKDSVSYLTGDRVDWKYFEIKTAKDLEISLRWTPQRDGQDLAFNVLDEGFNVLERAKPTPDSGKRKKEIDIRGAAPGRYYLQIYAPERSDAGDYTLEVVAKDLPTVLVSGPAIPDPPRLAMMPPNPMVGAGGACAPNAPAGTPCTCPPNNTPPPCPPPPPPCPPGAPAGSQCACPDGTSQPPCPIPDVVVYATITEVSQPSGGGLALVLNRGSKDKVGKGCPGVVLRGGSGDKELPNSTFTVTDATERESRATIGKMSLDELGKNRRTKMRCPQKGP
jgi:hypothetical protein